MSFLHAFEDVVGIATAPIMLPGVYLRFNLYSFPYASKD